jgi:hypothetical protein
MGSCISTDHRTVLGSTEKQFPNNRYVGTTRIFNNMGITQKHQTVNAEKPRYMNGSIG